MEPFGGAASVLMEKWRSHTEIYNDLNDNIVNLFRVLRNPKKAALLEKQLQLTPFSRSEWLEAKKSGRMSMVECARRTLIRGAMSYGADYVVRRSSNSGFRKASYQRYCSPAKDWFNYPSWLKLFTARLQGVIIENTNAFELIEQNIDKEECLIYLDPPYPHACRSDNNKKHGYSHELADADHERLLKLCTTANAMIIISGYDNDLYNSRLKDWTTAEKETRTLQQNSRTEKIWINPAAWAANEGHVQGIFQF